MPGAANKLQEVLDGYSKVLREKDLAPAGHQPHLVRWVREFLVFTMDHRGYSFQQTLDLFVAEVGARVGVNRPESQLPGQTGLPRPTGRPTNRSSPAENARVMLVKTRGSIPWPHGVG